MIRVEIAELKNRLSEFLREVERGDEIIVTDRDRPMARIVPIASPRGKVRIKKAKRPFDGTRQYPPPMEDQFDRAASGGPEPVAFS